MKIGVFLGMQYLPEDDPVARVREHVEQARLVAEAGYDSLWLTQHFVTGPNQFPQTLPLLSRLAAETREMALGTNVILLPLLHPVEVAEQYATLDVICGGRLILGVGLGYRPEEFAAFGIPMADRVGRFRESLEIIKRLWTEDEVSFHGKHFHVTGASARPRPVQRPRPPIWIGAQADRAVERAARLGDAWLAAPTVSVPTTARSLELYRRARAAAGLPPATEFAKCLDLYVAPTREQALREGGPAIAAKYRSYATWGQSRQGPESSDLAADIEEVARDRLVVGDPEDCLREFLRHRDELGVTHLLIRAQFPGLSQRQVLDCLSLIAERVVPAVR